VIVARSPPAFESMVRAYSGDLFRFAYWQCRDRFLAEDVVQETFTRAWKAWSTLESHEAVKSWLYAILRHEIARLYEKKRLRIDPDQDLDELRGEAESDPSVTLEMREALQALPFAYRERLRGAARKIAEAAGGLVRVPWGWRAPFAVAATLVLAVSIVLFHASPIPDEGLAIADIAHVAHVAQERIQDLEATPEADPSALPKVLAASGVRLPSDFQEVRYLGRCGPADRSGQHIVMQTQSGMASLVLMPGESARFRIVQFDDGRTAVVAPAPVGSLAVVADSRQTAVQIAERLL
jgi:RNA polymerase sigma factor (sigma-70 family)